MGYPVLRTYIYLQPTKQTLPEMIKIDNFIKLFEGAVRDSWDNPALSDFRKSTITYRELAERIDTLDLVWKKAGLKRGDKIAINARPCAMGASL